MFHISMIFLKVLIHSIRALMPIWMTFMVLISGLGVLVAHLEKLTIHDGLYFAWITGTTVGYGDIVPERHISQILCILIAVIGVLFTGTLVAISVNALKITFQVETGQDQWEAALKERLKKKKSAKP